MAEQENNVVEQDDDETLKLQGDFRQFVKPTYPFDSDQEQRIRELIREEMLEIFDPYRADAKKEFKNNAP